MKRKVLLVTATMFAMTILGETHAAQDVGVRRPIYIVSNNPKPASGAKLRVKARPNKIQRVVVAANITPQTKIVNVKIKTSNLVISTETNAEVSLASSVKGATTMLKKVPADGTVEFENLTPGKYLVSAKMEGFYQQETEVDVVPQKTVGIALELEPVTYQLTIEANVNDGVVRYAPARLLGSNPDGSLKTVETGGYCIVPIKDGKALIKELKKGVYNLDVEATAVEYEKTLTAINVPGEILSGEDEDPNIQQSYRIELEKKVSTETFGSAWTSSEWIMPSGWKLQGSMKTEGFEGVALPRNEQYRYYTNFEMKSGVRLLDGGTVGFVVRALDAKNYYLVQISGAKAAEPYRVKGYVVKNGEAKQLFANPLEGFASTIAEQKWFNVVIKGEDNKFRLFIVDSKTGDERELGNVIDRDGNFRKGAVGIAGQQKSNFEVGLFTVCAPLCR
ncbi:MAG: carboxypeptidase-like regulatory domain-containing protein [Pyrinomonadaceae bacterium]|nr:carboxypeptidase-like regulatory domain-containing protein [Pyrinomonadaceae bacterium]